MKLLKNSTGTILDSKTKTERKIAKMPRVCASQKMRLGGQLATTPAILSDATRWRCCCRLPMKEVLGKPPGIETETPHSVDQTY